MSIGVFIPSRTGYLQVQQERIILLEADDNYCFIHLEDGRKHIVARTLKSFLPHFENNSFIPVHRRYLLNVKFIEAISKGKFMKVLLTNGLTVAVSRNHRNQVLNMIKTNEWELVA